MTLKLYSQISNKYEIKCVWKSVIFKVKTFMQTKFPHRHHLMTLAQKNWHFACVGRV